MKDLERLLKLHDIEHRLYPSGLMRVSRAEFTVSASGKGKATRYNIHLYDRIGRRRTYSGKTAADVLRIAKARIVTLS